MRLEAAPWQGIIGPAPPSAPLWPMLAWGLLGVVLLTLLLGLFWLWWYQPRRTAGRRLGRIRRAIAGGGMEPRAALHAAAACLAGLPLEARALRLLQQRFSPRAPDAGAVASLLQELQRGLGR